MSIELLAKTLVNTPVPVLPAELQGLTAQAQDQIGATLANDEASTDEEIVELWTTKCGIPETAARAAIKFREHFQRHIFFELFPRRQLF